jgi:Galactose binding lectin domain
MLGSINVLTQTNAPPTMEDAVTCAPIHPDRITVLVRPISTCYPINARASALVGTLVPLFLFALPVLPCLAGTFVATQGTLSSDVVCRACVAGVAYSNTTNSNTCTAVGVCAAGTYILTEGTSTTPRVCSNCTARSYTLVESVASCVQGVEGATVTAKCSAGYVIAAITWACYGQFASCASQNCNCGLVVTSGIHASCTGKQNCSYPATNTQWSDSCRNQAKNLAISYYCQLVSLARSCTGFVTCPMGTFISTEGTSSSSRTCSNCSAQSYTLAPNSTFCSGFVTCQAGQFILSEGTSSTVRVCSNCSESYTSAPNITSCTELSSCTATATTTILSNGSSTSDRVCANCSMTGCTRYVILTLVAIDHFLLNLLFNKCKVFCN